MSKNAVRQWVFSGVVTCILFVGVAAAETPSRLTACATSTPPFVLGEKNRAVGGFSVELLQTLAAAMKRELDVSEVPWARCLNEVKAGRVDIAIDAYDDAERRRLYHYSEPYYTLTPQVFYSTRFGAKAEAVRSAGGLAKLTGCGVNEYTYDHYDLDANLLDRGATDNLQMMKKLLAGRCDYAIEELEVIIGHRQTNKNWPDEAELRSFQPQWARGPKLHFLVGKKHQHAAQLIPQLNAGIASAIKSGEVTRLRAKYRIESLRP